MAVRKGILGSIYTETKGFKTAPPFMPSREASALTPSLFGQSAGLVTQTSPDCHTSADEKLLGDINIVL